jgi:hypothetical protein
MYDCRFHDQTFSELLRNLSTLHELSLSSLSIGPRAIESFRFLVGFGNLHTLEIVDVETDMNTLLLAIIESKICSLTLMGTDMEASEPLLATAIEKVEVPITTMPFDFELNMNSCHSGIFASTTSRLILHLRLLSR